MPEVSSFSAYSNSSKFLQIGFQISQQMPTFQIWFQVLPALTPTLAWLEFLAKPIFIALMTILLPQQSSSGSTSTTICYTCRACLWEWKRQNSRKKNFTSTFVLCFTQMLFAFRCSALMYTFLIFSYEFFFFRLIYLRFLSKDKKKVVQKYISFPKLFSSFII